MDINQSVIQDLRIQLDQHPIYDAVETVEDLKCFMEHHVYSVWDFMSLIKSLQSLIAPTQTPWRPTGDARVRRFINELVLEEESDETHIPGEFSSHFELYLRAMREIGCQTRSIEQFIQSLPHTEIDKALQNDAIPVPSQKFTAQTFQFIHAQQPHVVAAALALGREHIIPNMFRTILKKIGVNAEQAPIFHFYLNRHIHLDEDFHAPLSLRLLNELCAGDTLKLTQAVEAAQLAVKARIRFWDGVLSQIKSNKTSF